VVRGFHLPLINIYGWQRVRSRFARPNLQINAHRRRGRAPRTAIVFPRLRFDAEPRRQTALRHFGHTLHFFDPNASSVRIGLYY
jgi:hypothetical protein